MISNSQIREKAGEYFTRAVELRRHFHMYPELSYNETATSGFITKLLDEMCINYTDNIAGAGIIASIEGKKGSGPVIALRAELDALPVAEKTGVEYASRHSGVMHACGHDAHMAMLLASMMTLNDLSSELSGEVLFIFQPGEELTPGGASLVMKEGTLLKKKPAAIIAQHVYPELESGQVGYMAGPYMASSDELYIEISGRGGHAALPDNYTDQILAGSTLITRLKNRLNSLDPETPKVLAIGTFKADGATNVIPASARLEGTIRTFSEETRLKIHSMIRGECRAVSKEFGVEVSEDIRNGYPVLVNDTGLSEIFSEVAKGLWGEKNVVPLNRRMSSEDFSFYSGKFPVFFYRLGTGFSNEETARLHSPDFKIDESALLTGITTLSAMAVSLLKLL